ncbi:MAG: hypothetical protein IJQ37_02895 [Clostridia bacterium]|nr:hypothetical protein [Clostridia bacterium]
MYSKNFMGDSPEKITVPPEYGGTSVGADRFPPPPPPPPPKPDDCRPDRLPAPPKHGLLDGISSEDLLLFGAALLILSRDGDDILSLGLLILLILL